MQIANLINNKTVLIVLALTLCIGITGCDKEAQGNEENHDVTLPVVAQGFMNFAVFCQSST